MNRQAWATATLAAAALVLGACSERADQNPNAPGSPGTGNSAEVVKPAAPDSPPGGPSGIAGSQPHPGSSGGDMVPGTTGRGSADPANPQPGTGLHGGLGTGVASTPGTASATTSAPMGAGPAVPPGSSNTTSGSAVGQR